jgi:two-component system sensor histidine kinase EvgS
VRKCLLLSLVFGLMCFTLLGKTQTYATPLDQFTPTPKEQEWLSQHTHIRFTGDPNWLPFEAFEGDQYVGIVASFLKEFEDRLSIQKPFERIPSDSWSHTLAMAEQGQVDVVSGDLADENLRRTHTFTEPFLRSPLVIVSYEMGSAVNDLNALGDDAIGIIKGYGYTWDLWEAYPQTNMIEVADVSDGLAKLESGMIRYLVMTQTLGQFTLAQHPNNTLHIRGQLPITVDLGFAVRNDWPELLAMLNRVIASIPPHMQHQIAQTWYLNNADRFTDYSSWWTLASILIIAVCVLLGWVYTLRLQQLKIQEQRKNYADALLGINAGDWWISLPNQALHVSEAFLSQLNAASHRIAHLNDLINTITPQDQPSAIKAFDTLLTGHTSLELECRLQAKDQSVIWVKIKGKAIKHHKDGTASRISGIIEDISDRKAHELELKQFKQFAHHSSQGMGIAGFDTQIHYLNPTLMQWLEGTLLTDHEVKRRHIAQYYPEKYRAFLKDTVFPTILKEGYWKGELELLASDGTTIPTYETFFLIRDENGNPEFIGDIMIDMSLQKAAQHALEHAKIQADQANASKSTFLANMSHEIRTPLNAVLGYSQLLLHDPSFNEEQQGQLRRIQTAGQRLLRLINDVLDLSKIEAGKLTLNNESFDLFQECEDIVHLHQAKGEEKQLSVVYEPEISPNEWVRTDRTKLGQILSNLLDNAIKFTPKGRVTLQAKRTGDEISFLVTDTGPGISYEDQRQLFRPFVQGQSGNQQGGTGLGLVLSRRLAELLGGLLKLNSQQSLGTQVLVKLPLPAIKDSTSTAGALKPTSQTVHQRGLTALVVEDDEMSRDILVQILNRTGFKTYVAHSGRQGIELAHLRQPDIIFTDIRMPEMDGVEMLRRLRTQSFTRDLPIIAVSASSLEHERRFYLDQGFDDFVGKPVDFNELIRVIQEHLQLTPASNLQNPNNPIKNKVESDLYTESTTQAQNTEVLSKGDTFHLKSALDAAQAGDVDQTALHFSNISDHLNDHLRSTVDQSLKRYDLESVSNAISRYLTDHSNST